MEEHEVIALIHRIVDQKLAPILMATLQSNESSQRSTFQHFATSNPIPNARSIQPYGISSRAPAGTAVVAVPIDGQITHINIMGHFDANKPTGADGETILYNQFGQQVYLSNGKIQIGSPAAAENLVLGQVFKTFMADLLDEIANHTHPGNGFKPSDSAAFEAFKASPINDEAILSDEVFTEKG